ncbi:UDP-N-acetylmuramoyl-L-alanyl-D-glutamate--2,6-diaminopimelate ligase [Halobacillus amylolyticus]|uniref:UDP-N-acetylmuramoyl-L-alanyl-D-glutamate--2, 6-diaminopimelate ligase n=1 Tax=Halobacillus amylolyticus TaxID=2932259 RepID=A0ABY4HBR4_9BACI|nr:UDP-N-acetylmuramoyl-L-alanyl-D-glutamate--2,6-diaminopimelate ligase [Halobacillus amylolyticus]UOR12049.1 UDP-N-acetylmuramoyl-L-alanyl-D-glutamate--2,6-diaminopimelate ligase [Halobacillus amylolyticus]
MKLLHLIEELETETEDKSMIKDISVQGIADSSLDVEKNFIFVAIKGFNTDGHSFIGQAIQKGACAVVGEEDITDSLVPYIRVKSSRRALGIIANKFYGSPSKDKLLIGVTGTNGKTTTSYLLRHVLEANGISCSMIGTIQNVINGEVTQCVNTTPGSLVIHELLSNSNDEVAIMEVSSHALTQHRVEGLKFDYCLFTNLYHDHLDYHTSMEEYFHAKALLFDKLQDDGQAIVNTDSSWGEKLSMMLQDKGKRIYAIGEVESSDLRLLNFNLESSTITVKENNELIHICSPMSGVHNMYNVAMAYATAKHLKLGEECILNSIYGFTGVDGRFEVSQQDNGSMVVVDYAHTPDAIFHCLRTARLCGAKRVLHIFGFRGDRDSTKRQEMLSITSELSDHYILTVDDLNAVSHKEMVGTLKYLNDTFGNEKGMVVADRTIAIKQALDQSIPGDWIVITGKGHEQYQQNYHLPTESDKDTIMYLNNTKRQLLE